MKSVAKQDESGPSHSCVALTKTIARLCARRTFSAEPIDHRRSRITPLQRLFQGSLRRFQVELDAEEFRTRTASYAQATSTAHTMNGSG